jgi:hypothetical protein
MSLSSVGYNSACASEAALLQTLRFSKRFGKSVSMIVADYFEKLDVPPPEEIEAITPKVATLRGILKKTGVE